MLVIDKYVFRILTFALVVSSTACVFASLAIALKTGDAPANLAALGVGLFGTTIAFVSKESK